MENDLHMSGDTLPMSRSDVGMRVSIRKTLRLLRREKVRKVDGTYMHIIMVTHTG